MLSLIIIIIIENMNLTLKDSIHLFALIKAIRSDKSNSIEYIPRVFQYLAQFREIKNISSSQTPQLARQNIENAFQQLLPMIQLKMKVQQAKQFNLVLNWAVNKFLKSIQVSVTTINTSYFKNFVGNKQKMLNLVEQTRICLCFVVLAEILLTKGVDFDDFKDYFTILHSVKALVSSFSAIIGITALQIQYSDTQYSNFKLFCSILQTRDYALVHWVFNYINLINKIDGQNSIKAKQRMRAYGADISSWVQSLTSEGILKLENLSKMLNNIESQYKAQIQLYRSYFKYGQSIEEIKKSITQRQKQLFQQNKILQHKVEFDIDMVNQKWSPLANLVDTKLQSFISKDLKASSQLKAHKYKFRQVITDTSFLIKYLYQGKTTHSQGLILANKLVYGEFRSKNYELFIINDKLDLIDFQTVLKHHWEQNTRQFTTRMKNIYDQILFYILTSQQVKSLRIQGKNSVTSIFLKGLYYTCSAAQANLLSIQSIQFQKSFSSFASYLEQGKIKILKNLTLASNEVFYVVFFVVFIAQSMKPQLTDILKSFQKDLFVRQLKILFKRVMDQSDFRTKVSELSMDSAITIFSQLLYYYFQGKQNAYAFLMNIENQIVKESQSLYVWNINHTYLQNAKKKIVQPGNINEFYDINSHIYKERNSAKKTYKFGTPVTKKIQEQFGLVQRMIPQNEDQPRPWDEKDNGNRGGGGGGDHGKEKNNNDDDDDDDDDDGQSEGAAEGGVEGGQQGENKIKKKKRAQNRNIAVPNSWKEDEDRNTVKQTRLSLYNSQPNIEIKEIQIPTSKNPFNLSDQPIFTQINVQFDRNFMQSRQSGISRQPVISRKTLKQQRSPIVALQIQDKRQNIPVGFQYSRIQQSQRQSQGQQFQKKSQHQFSTLFNLANIRKQQNPLVQFKNLFNLKKIGLNKGNIIVQKTVFDIKKQRDSKSFQRFENLKEKLNKQNVSKFKNIHAQKGSQDQEKFIQSGKQKKEIQLISSRIVQLQGDIQDIENALSRRKLKQAQKQQLQQLKDMNVEEMRRNLNQYLDQIILHREGQQKKLENRIIRIKVKIQEHNERRNQPYLQYPQFPHKQTNAVRLDNRLKTLEYIRSSLVRYQKQFISYSELNDLFNNKPQQYNLIQKVKVVLDAAYMRSGIDWPAAYTLISQAVDETNSKITAIKNYQEKLAHAKKQNYRLKIVNQCYAVFSHKITEQLTIALKQTTQKHDKVIQEIKVLNQMKRKNITNTFAMLRQCFTDLNASIKKSNHSDTLLKQYQVKVEAYQEHIKKVITIITDFIHKTKKSLQNASKKSDVVSNVSSVIKNIQAIQKILDPVINIHEMKSIKDYQPKSMQFNLKIIEKTLNEFYKQTR